MKKKDVRIKSFISFGMIGFLMLMLGACTPGNGENSQLVLFGATNYTASASNTSYLYQVSTTDGTTTQIGDIGFKVNSMAYDSVTGKLYGITEGGATQLISIDKSTGAGTLIADITGVTSVAVNNGWNGTDTISSIGATGTNYYAQSFIANVNIITKIGVVIQEIETEGEIRIGIAANIASDYGGVPNYAAPLYMGSLINPTTTAQWYYEEGINVPVTPGQKYYILLDGYNIAGTTGKSGIGTSAVQPISGEGIIFLNDGWNFWDSRHSYPLAIYVEGVPVFTNLTFNSSGELFAWNSADNSVCSINTTTGVATCAAASGVTAANSGLAFDNSDVLYLVNGGGNVYTINTATGAATSAGTISGLPSNMAYHGDFNPRTGVYWGLDATSGTARNLLVIDMDTFTLSQTISTLDNMYALAFGYK